MKPRFTQEEVIKICGDHIDLMLNQISECESAKPGLAEAKASAFKDIQKAKVMLRKNPMEAKRIAVEGWHKVCRVYFAS